MANRWGKKGNSETLIWGLQNHCDCSHEIKRCLLLGRKAMTNVDSILKSRDIMLATKVHLVKAMVFLVVMYGYESWTIKKAECWRIELWCWRRLFRVPWTARRSNQSILMKSVLNTHWKEWCWNWSSNILATWCAELTHWKQPWCWERLKAGGEGDNRWWDSWIASPTWWIWVWASSGSWWWTGKPGVLHSMGHKESDMTEWLNWTFGFIFDSLVGSGLCCLISIYLWIPQISSCYWFLISYYWGQKGYLIQFQSFEICWHLFCDLTYQLFWRMSMCTWDECILYFWGMFVNVC